ncbi:hypothetical protein M422DRAFT_246575 [Sphaerobolus stellatus SS14]|nr:hypothetical protein M422DRAFT_246575 [Sphaerobolus stellatus SS14]
MVATSPTENEGLYWTLNGGGGSTYGIVWSVTVIAHPNFPMTIANLSSTSDGISPESYWDAIRAFQASTPNFTDNGITILSIYSASSFSIRLLITPKLSVSQVDDVLGPFLTRQRTLGME